MSQDGLFKRALAISLFLHLALFLGFYIRNAFFISEKPSTIELDLTKPFLIGHNPLLKPGGGNAPKIPMEKIGPPPTPTPNPQPKEVTKPKDWVLPGPATKVLEKPKDESGPPPAGKSLFSEPGGTGEGYPGTGGGWGGGEGQGGGIPLARYPKLLNMQEIMKLLKKNYPIAERQSGQEGTVVLDLHLSAEGSVTGADVIDSAGADFDTVARMVAKKMRFTPAMVQSGGNTVPVAVKVRQSIQFNLEQDD